MFLVALSCVLLVVGIGAAVKAARNEAQFLRARRHGIQTQADVVDNDITATGNRRGDFRTPVVRYHVGGRAYTAALCNSNGLPGAVGSGITVVVHPDHPYAPFDRYGGMGASSRGLLALFALTVVVFVLMLATR